jgi:hypothetical protein
MPIYEIFYLMTVEVSFVTSSFCASSLYTCLTSVPADGYRPFSSSPLALLQIDLCFPVLVIGVLGDLIYRTPVNDDSNRRIPSFIPLKCTQWSTEHMRSTYVQTNTLSKMFNYVSEQTCHRSTVLSGYIEV